MKYLTTKETASKWNVNDRRVRVLCEEGRVDGAFKVGKTWMIAENASKPYDARKSIKKEYKGLEHDFSKIDSMKKIIDQHRPLSTNVVKSLREKLIIDWTYNSNAIEGNTLTMSETKVVLEGITIGGKSVTEHLEVINHKEAIEYIEIIIKEKKDLTEWTVRNIHQLILKDIDNNNAGKYRNENVTISGASHIPPNHIIISEVMQELFAEYDREWNDYHPVIKACLLHGEFVKIHPFIDGNGRTARLILNFELMKYGYTPIVITKSRRAEYYEALDLAHTTLDYSKFISLISDFLIDSELLWLRIIQ
ncbi:MAG: Fic family protein [Candidatus Izemoplasmatales bacterium]|nr:Fic family protein [Candidatus Izemoplasmatales bacterium]